MIGNEPRIEALGLALNRMLDRLDNAYSHVSRFSADAAHELAHAPDHHPRRTGAGRVPAMRLPADVDHAISNALEEMTRLSGIVDSLITLSRMESLWGKRSMPRSILMALATETIDQMQPAGGGKAHPADRPAGAAGQWWRATANVSSRCWST